MGNVCANCRVYARMDARDLDSLDTTARGNRMTSREINFLPCFKPLLMNGQKIQTWRPFKNQPGENWVFHSVNNGLAIFRERGDYGTLIRSPTFAEYPCPYGAPGDEVTHDGETYFIQSVYVERIQAISRNSALCSGITHQGDNFVKPNEPTLFTNPHDAYRSLFMEIYGGLTWRMNPWCWAIAFKRIF